MKSFSRLYARAQESPTYQAERLKVRFMAEVYAQMKQQGMNNAALARALNVSPAYIAKLFRGPANVSAETMAKLGSALNCNVHIHLARQAAEVRWFDVLSRARPAMEELPSTDWSGFTNNTAEAGKHVKKIAAAA